MKKALLDQLEIKTQEILAVAIQLVVFILCVFFLGAVIGVVANSIVRASKNGWFGKVALNIRNRSRVWLALVAAIGCCLILCYDAYLIFNQLDVYENTIGELKRIPTSLWIQLSIGAMKIFAYVMVASIILRSLGPLIIKAENHAKDFKKLTANDESIEAFFRSFIRIITTCIWLLVVYFSSLSIQLPKVISSFCLLFLKLYLILAVAILMAKAITAAVDSIDALSIKYASPDNLLRFYDNLRSLVPLFRRCLEFVLYAIAAALVVGQIDPISNFSRYGVSIAQVIGIFFISRVVTELSFLLIDQLLLKDKRLSEEEQQRRETLVPLIKSTLRYFILIGAFVLMLGALGINPAPVLAGAGILGLVVGLGAQSVLNDVISGFFILFEDLFLVGDFIKADGAEGVVEEIDIRTTRIRNPDGQLSILRNGQLIQVVNYSKGYTYAVVEVGVAYDSDLNFVRGALLEAGETLAENNPNVLGIPEFQGLEKFGESELLMRTRTRVKPGCHLQVARDYRMLIKELFDGKGIEIPFARRVLLFKKENLEELRGCLPFKDSLSLTHASQKDAN